MGHRDVDCSRTSLSEFHLWSLENFNRVYIIMKFCLNTNILTHNQLCVEEVIVSYRLRMNRSVLGQTFLTIDILMYTDCTQEDF
jgi:hypothetical protein